MLGRGCRIVVQGIFRRYGTGPLSLNPPNRLVDKDLIMASGIYRGRVLNATVGRSGTGQDVDLITD